MLRVEEQRSERLRPSFSIKSCQSRVVSSRTSRDPKWRTKPQSSAARASFGSGARLRGYLVKADRSRDGELLFLVAEIAF